jgi:hypothetical protein
MSQPQRVFISYSHDSDDHDNRVLALADALRASGIAAVVDQYYPNPPEGWPHWMERNFDAADYVLMICTGAYHDRVTRSQPVGTGLGAQWEGGHIYNILYADPNLGDRFIPVLIDGASKDYIPQPLRGHTRYAINDFTLSDPGYEALYRHLTGQPATPEPPLGNVTPMPPKPRGSGGNPP